MQRVAITRDVSPDMSGCELSFVGRTSIDFDLAQRQHRDYQAALAALGCQVVSLPAQANLPDAVFVEDTALVLDEFAVLTRPGAHARRAEVDTIAEALAPYRRLHRMQAPATLDGGDVLRDGRRLFVGLSARSNRDAIEALARLVGPEGYQVIGVPIRGCLHLKSAVTRVASDAFLLQPRWVDAEAFRGGRIIEVDPDEEHAANALPIGDGLLYPDCFPRTGDRLRAAGIDPTLVDVSELQKAEGAVTCCSLVFEINASP